MSRLREFGARLAASLRGESGREADAERLREEWAGHREALGAEARQKLRGEDAVSEAWRDQRGLPWLEDLRRDLSVGWRGLQKAPGFTLVVVLSLALGIGANAAIFSVLDAALYQNLPVQAPRRLALLYWHARTWPKALNQSGQEGPADVAGVSSYSLAYPTYEYLREHAGEVFSGVAGFAPISFGAATTALMVHRRTTLTRAELVTGGFFAMLGLRPAAGRLLGVRDGRAGAPEAAVLSYGFWRRQFGGSRAVIGRAVELNGAPATIVGVAPRGFEGVEPGTNWDVWAALSPTTPAALAPWGYVPPNLSIVHATAYWWLQVMARLRPGVSRARAQAELEPAFRRITRAGLNPAPTGNGVPELGLLSGAQGINGFRSDNGQSLYILMAVVGLLLLLACVNVAALLLARAAARRREIGVRLALGARRSRLVRQLLTESVLLALLGGAAGALLAPLGVKLLLRLMGEATALAVRLNPAIVLFTVAISLATGILFGLAPALRSTRVQLAGTLGTVRTPAGERQRLRGDKALAMSQVALSLVLLIAAGLFARTLDALQRRPLGFDPDHLLVFGLNGEQAGYHGAELVALYRNLAAKLAALPGVSGVTASRLGLLTGWSSSFPLQVPGMNLPRAARQSDHNGVGPHFFRVMGIPMRLGRDFTGADLTSSRPVAVVSATLARNLFGAADPLGREVTSDGRGGPVYTIVGVAADARYSGVRGKMPAVLYTPYSQMPAPVSNLVFEVRLAGDPQAVVPEVRSAIRGLDPALALAGVKLQADVDAEHFGPQRMFAALSGFFGLLGLLLAAIGLEGTMAYAVARRTGEIGIRMALGARRGQVLAAVLRETLGLTLAGVAAGLLGAWAASRLLAGQLYGVAPTDPATFAAAAVLMLAAAALAGGWPALRAARVDPMLALRAE